MIEANNSTDRLGPDILPAEILIVGNKQILHDTYGKLLIPSSNIEDCGGCTTALADFAMSRVHGSGKKYNTYDCFDKLHDISNPRV